MSVASFAIPIPVLVFMASVAAVFLVIWLARRETAAIDADATMIIAVGLIAARIAFVARFFSLYRNAPLSVFNVRDLGFDPLVGPFAGALVTAWCMASRKKGRATLGLALIAGLTTFATARTLAGAPRAPSAIPAVEL